MSLPATCQINVYSISFRAWKSHDANLCRTKFRLGLTRKRIFISSALTAKNVSKISSRCRTFPNDCLKPSVTDRKSFCGGRIFSCSCLTTCTRCFPFRRPANRLNWSSANGRNGRPRSLESSGSAISSSIGCDTTKAVARRRTTSWRIPSVKSWLHARKNGRSFISVTSNDRSSTVRDGALRRPRRVQRRNQRRDPHVRRGSFRPLHAGGDIAARCPYHSISQNVAGVAARIFGEILLVVVFRRVEFRGGRDLRCDRAAELA